MHVILRREKQLNVEKDMYMHNNKTQHLYQNIINFEKHNMIN